MLPSSGASGSRSGGGGRGSALRRYGPVAAIVAAIAVVGGVLALSGGGGDEGGSDEGGSDEAAITTSTTGAGSATGSSSEGDEPEVRGPDAEPLSFSRAEEEGVEADFGEGCDPDTGRAAIPWYFAGECWAGVEDNGGDTAPGVSADAIKVVVYLAPESDPIIDFITAAIANDDTNDQARATYEGFTELFQSYSQTYGRTVELEFLEGSGNAADPVAARADAVRAAEEMGAFAVWGGPVLTPAWREELAAREVLVLGYGGTREVIESQAPYVQSITAIQDQARAHLVEWMSKSLAGGPAEHAGDPALQSRERVFGLLHIDIGDETEAAAEALDADLSEVGIDLAERVPYTLDPVRLQEQAASAIAQLESAGVTTVIFNGDPVAPASFTAEATRQEYFPEWIHSPGSTLVDTAAFARTYDQRQWAHSFGVTTGTVRLAPDATQVRQLYEWFHGEGPPADDTYGVQYPLPSVFFGAVQAAGPNLTAASFAEGLARLEPRQGTTQVAISWGDHGIWEVGTDVAGVDDATELWWDPETTGPDELEREGQGMYRYVDGGARHYPGDWPEGDTRAFDPEGAEDLVEEPPAEEAAPQYPSPAGGSG